MSKYQFYVKMEGDVYGPYSIDEVRDLGLLDDTEVMESSLGEWHPACCYDFDDLYMQEHGFIVAEDGQVHRGPRHGVNNGNTNGNGNGTNTSSSQDPHYCPPSAKGWSWGAFFFSWLWGICNDVYWPLIMLIPVVGQIAGLIIVFVLGANGKEMAWKNGNWRTEDVAEFNRKQDGWSSAAGWIIFIGIALIVISAVLE